MKTSCTFLLAASTLLAPQVQAQTSTPAPIFRLERGPESFYRRVEPDASSSSLPQESQGAPLPNAPLPQCRCVCPNPYPTRYSRPYRQNTAGWVAGGLLALLLIVALIAH